MWGPWWVGCVVASGAGYVILDVEPFAAPQLVKGLRNMAETVWLREIL